MRDLRKEILRLLDYDQSTGLFLWKIDCGNQCRTRSIAGTVNGRGTFCIQIAGTKWIAARLAWLIVTGTLPSRKIDHKDRNPLNNRFTNLRLASDADNSRNRSMGVNNTSGIKGVSWHKATSKWTANIRANGKAHYLGLFDSRDLAGAAYARAAIEFHGEFASPLIERPAL